MSAANSAGLVEPVAWLCINLLDDRSETITRNESLAKWREEHWLSYEVKPLFPSSALEAKDAEIASLQARIEALTGERDRAAENERDRLYADAEMQYAAAELRRDDVAAEFHSNAANWLKHSGNGAMFPRDRAASRSQEPPHGR